MAQQNDPAAQVIQEGRALLHEGKTSQAIDHFRRAATAYPKSALIHNEFGVALFTAGEHTAAIKQLKAATKLDSRLASTWANLGEAQRLTGQFKPCALSFHKFLKFKKGDRYAVYGLALCFEGYQAFDKALRTLTVAKKRAGDDPRLTARVNIAIKRVRSKVAGSRLPLMERGDTHLMAGRWSQALELYQRALKKQKNNPTLLGRRGLARAILGDKEGALLDLEAALLADPAADMARAAYARLLDSIQGGAGAAIPSEGRDLLAKDRAAAASRAYTSASGADKSASSSAGRGEARLRLGLLEGAVEDFAAAGDDPLAVSGLAEVLILRDQVEAAQERVKGIDGAPAHAMDIPAWRRSLIK